MVWLLTALACTTPQAPADATPISDAPTEATKSPPAPNPECVAACLQRRMAEPLPADRLEAECRLECTNAGSTPTQGERRP